MRKKFFFVISYDRRGEGRNADLEADFTFNQSFEDTNQIYQKYGVEKASLIGHSFGGDLAILYAEKFPDKINSLIVASTPVVF